MRSLLRLPATAVLALALLVTAIPTGRAQAATTVVMSYNTYYDAHTGIDRAAGVIRSSGATIVALQETRDTATAQLAGALGWSSYTSQAGT